MKVEIFEPGSIGLQCRKYKEIIEAQTVADWAGILGVDFIVDSNLTSTFIISPDPTDWWHKVDRVVGIHSNNKKLQFLFSMSNGEVAGLRVSDLKSMWHFGFLRLLIEKEFGRNSSLTIRELE